MNNLYYNRFSSYRELMLNLFSCFVRRSFSDNFYQIILNSDHRFHRTRFCKSLLSQKATPTAHWWYRILTFQISFSYLCRATPNNCFCQIEFNSDYWFRRRRCLKCLTYVHEGNWPRPLGGHVFDGQIRFSYFCGRSSSYHFYQIIYF